MQILYVVSIRYGKIQKLNRFRLRHVIFAWTLLIQHFFAPILSYYTKMRASFSEFSNPSPNFKEHYIKGVFMKHTET